MSLAPSAPAACSTREHGAYRKQTLVPPSEPKLPATRTLPPVDVIFEDDLFAVGQKSSHLDSGDKPEKTESTAVRVSPADLAVLRRIALRAGEAPVSEPPRSSIRVAAKATGRGALIGSAVIGVISLVGALDPTIVARIVTVARVVGEVARAVAAGYGAQ